jgi:hypothetical protein
MPADPRYRAIIDAREFPDATPPTKVSVSVWGLGALHVFTGLGSHFSLDGIKADQMMEIGTRSSRQLGSCTRTRSRR